MTANTNKWIQNQRVQSQSEPELGIGLVESIDEEANVIVVYFSQSKVARQYSTKTAPLERIELSLGENFQSQTGENFYVESKNNKNGLIYYKARDIEFCEKDITLIATGEEGLKDIFASGALSDHKLYDLRKEAWLIKSASLGSKVRGLVGARVQPLPHQLYIAHQVARRASPRVILADEVGLGKTIEAGLIYLAMKSLNRADRVLILTPSSLVHQWMSEFFRKFGELFSVIDRDRIHAEAASQKLPGFQANQRCIADIQLLIEEPGIFDQACKTSWDLIIVDEAHHLDWNQEQASDSWKVVKRLSHLTHGLLLLTATPRHHGLETQFGLLNLVDPNQYDNFGDFCVRSDAMKRTAAVAKELETGKVSESIKSDLLRLFDGDDLYCSLISKLPSLEYSKEILQGLVDRHGTGRVFFRNRRERLAGFPKRKLFPVQLKTDRTYDELLSAINSDLVSDRELLFLASGRGSPNAKTLDMGRVTWLRDFLNSNQAEKHLVMCTSKETTICLSQTLGQFGFKIAVFHEDLDPVERDKEAARFSQSPGAQVLICSEIGGEGRNFQFARNLILFDLPTMPDTLEQRIGRLDRIGQHREIHIHVPWRRDSPEDVLFSWFSDGIGSFKRSWNGADILLEEFADDILELIRVFIPKHRNFDRRREMLATLIDTTKAAAKNLLSERAVSVDVLMDINSYNPELGEELLELVDIRDDDPKIEFFLCSMFDHYGVDYEELDDRGSLVVKSDSLMFIENFPGLNANEETLIAFDRNVALGREELLFLSIDHPLLESCLSLLVEKKEGSCSICKWSNSGLSKRIIFQITFVLDIGGPVDLELGSFLPLSVMEYCIDHTGKTLSGLTISENPDLLTEIRSNQMPFSVKELTPKLTSIMIKASENADIWARGLVDKAKKDALARLDQEISRAVYLAKINQLTGGSEIENMKHRRCECEKSFSEVKARADSVRIVVVD